MMIIMTLILKTYHLEAIIWEREEGVEVVREVGDQEAKNQVLDNKKMILTKIFQICPASLKKVVAKVKKARVEKNRISLCRVNLMSNLVLTLQVSSKMKMKYKWKAAIKKVEDQKNKGVRKTHKMSNQIKVSDYKNKKWCLGCKTKAIVCLKNRYLWMIATLVNTILLFDLNQVLSMEK